MMMFEQGKKNSDHCNSRVRGRTQIIADILHQCKENKRKSHVMQKANLNFEQVNHYLGDLQSRGFVEPGFTEESRTYRTTDRGREFLDRYQKLNGLFNDHRNNENAKRDRANVNLVKPIHHKTQNKTLAISFLLTIGLSMVISQSMPLVMTTTALSIEQQQLAYAQEENVATGDRLELDDVIVNTVDEKEKEDIGDSKGDEDEDEGESDNGGKINVDSDLDNGNDNQSEARDENDGVKLREIPILNGSSSVEQPIASTIDREPPDDDCLFDPSLPKCAPIDGECPDGFAMNEDGQCYPNKPCPKGYERRDNDETGTCYSVSENHLKVIVNVKGASGAGKISVESKGGAGDGRFADNIQGTHTFKFYKNSMPVGAELKACAYSDKLDKELCAKGRNGPEKEPEKVTISFNTKSERGLKVIVRIFSADGPGKIRVTSEEIDKTLSKTVGDLNGKHTFNFKAREVPIGGTFEVCAHSDKLNIEHCAKGRNGPENEPEEVGIVIREPPPT
jgi:predicted transcriptional regulator